MDTATTVVAATQHHYHCCCCHHCTYPIAAAGLIDKEVSLLSLQCTSWHRADNRGGLGWEEREGSPFEVREEKGEWQFEGIRVWELRGSDRGRLMFGVIGEGEQWLCEVLVRYSLNQSLSTGLCCSHHDHRYYCRCCCHCCCSCHCCCCCLCCHRYVHCYCYPYCTHTYFILLTHIHRYYTYH